MAVAIAADGVHSQDPDRAESATGATDRGHASQARACSNESSSAGGDDSGADSDPADYAAARAGEETGEAQEAPDYAGGFECDARCAGDRKPYNADPPNMRQQTDDSIASTEKTLNGITRKLNDQEQKTAAQIREYLKQAREALTAGNVDGANNLAFKAKVLLDELRP